MATRTVILISIENIALLFHCNIVCTVEGGRVLYFCYDACRRGDNV